MSPPQPPKASCYLGGIYVLGTVPSLARSSRWVVHCFLLCAYLYPEKAEGKTEDVSLRDGITLWTAAGRAYSMELETGLLLPAEKC